MTTLSVVMPVYNEAAGINDVIAEIATNVLDLVPDSELVIVDDRSTDGSSDLLAAAAAADPRVRVITNEVNSGHGRSVRRGMDASSGEWILHIDSDGQVDLREFAGLWDARDRSDLVLGLRVVRQDPFHRLVLTRLTSLIVSALTGRRVRDGNSPYKLIRRSLYDHLVPNIPADTFAPSILLVMGAFRARARVTEIGITHLPRNHGESTLHLAKLARVVVRCVAQTVAFRLRKIPPYPQT